MERVFEVFRALDADPSVRVVLLRGEGANFSTGLDLQAMGAEVAPLVGPALATERYALFALIEKMQGAINAVAGCKKPVIAAISGHCLGGGVDLITACDIRLCCDRRALLCARSAPRDGRRRGHARALALDRRRGNRTRVGAHSGWDDSTAARAVRTGLVNESFATHDLLFAQARAMAQRIANNPPFTVQGVKQLVNDRSERDARESLKYVALYNAAFLPSEDLREALSAWIEKRAPKFEGR